MPPPWRVVESPEYIADLEQIGGPGYDWAERREGVRFLLREGATRLGYGTQDSVVRIYLQDGPAGHPGLKVFYAVEEGEVTLIRARGYQMPADDEDDD